jgi:carboxyl-terminal processing protease
MRHVAGLLSLLLVLAAAPAVPAQDDDVPPAEYRRLLEVIRFVKAHYVTPVEDARLAGGCAGRLGGGDSAADLTRIPSLLRRAHADGRGDVAYARLVNDCLAGMIAGLDPRSEFLASDGGGPRTRRDGTFAQAGIGVELTRGGSAPEVVRALEGSPAERAGLEPGDRIVEIDGWATTGATLDAVVQRLRGAAGSSVTLVLDRAGARTTVSLTREIIVEQSVSLRALDPGVWHVRVSRLRDDTVRELERAIAGALDDGGPPRTGIVLDLRDNTGGLVTAMVDLASVFLREGLLVGQSEGRAPRASQRHVTRGRATGAPDTSAPAGVAGTLRAATLVVLVNGGTASGAEMVAAALQTHGRARVAGWPTAGLGTIQTYHVLNDGSAIRLTIARWIGPGGEALEGRPVTPDVTLTTARGPAESRRPTGGDDATLAQAIEVLRQPPLARPR